MPDLSWEFSLAWAGAEPAKCRFTHRSVGRAVVSVQWRAQKSRPWNWAERTEITLSKKQHPQDLRPGKSRICIAGGSAVVLKNSGKNSPRGGRNTGARAGHISRFQTADLVPAARFAPGFCILASQPRMKGWRSAESRTGARTPVGLHMTRQARHLARRLASHEGGRPPLGTRTVAILGCGAALPLTGISAGSVTANSHIRVVVPGGGAPASRGDSCEPPPRDATPRSAF